jgi:PAS domain S-box-containing protein
VCQDVTESNRGEPGLPESEARFRLMADAVPQIVWITDADGRLVFFNKQWADYIGLPDIPSTAREVADSYVHPDDAGYTMEAFEAARASGGLFEVEHRIRGKDGSYRWFLVRAQPYRDEATGRIVRWFGASVDIHDRKLAETALRESESRAKLLVAELQHRVRNSLSVVRSIARRTGATSDSVEEYAMHLDGRIDAFARVQSAVTRNPLAGIDLEILVAEELISVGAQEGGRVRGITGPKVRLQPKPAETVALAIHELATNAVKYGALCTETGRIKVGWDFEEAGGERQLVFRWIETGVNLSATNGRRRGFGIELIERTLAYDLGGEAALEFGRDGLSCTVRLPATPDILLDQGRPARNSDESA